MIDPNTPSRRQFDDTKDRYVALLRASTAVIWDMPPSGQFQRRQEDWERFTGQTFDQYRGAGWLDVVHPDDRERVRTEWNTGIQGQHPFELQYRMRRADGAYQWMNVRVTSLFDENTGALREWIGAHTDISEQKQIEASLRVTLARLESANRELLQANDAKSLFLATMSHELRTPLNAMIGYSELLLLGIPQQLSEAVRPHIERIDLSARHLLQLIEEVLTFSRIEAGTEHVHYETVQLADVLREVNAVMRPVTSAKKLEFNIDADADAGQIITDPRKIRQILLNLLGNATKFTQKGSITLRARIIGDQLLLRVEDTGTGIDSRYLEKIFEPFWQVESGKTRSIGGTGLGLAVTRELAVLMGGSVTVESTPGTGSAFEVTLPVHGKR